MRGAGQRGRPGADNNYITLELLPRDRLSPYSRLRHSDPALSSLALRRWRRLAEKGRGRNLLFPLVEGLAPLRRQVFPGGIAFFNQSDLLFTFPALDLFLAANGIIDVAKAFDVDEPMNAILPCKPRHQLEPVLEDSKLFQNPVDPRTSGVKTPVLATL